MSERADGEHERATDRGRPYPRAISRRAALALAAGTLALGVGVGAAIGPAPNASYAGVSPGVLQRLPELLAAITGREADAAKARQSAASAAAASAQSEAVARRRRRRRRHAAASASEASASSSEGEAQASTPAAKQKAGSKASKLPAVGSVWLIELAGESFTQAQSQPAAAPYITGTALHAGALLSGWSALQGQALASEAALLAPTSAAGTPPLVRSIVQPPCPEGAAGAGCATPAGALAAADAFLKETLAQITGGAAYREGGLVVVTFATVAIAAQQGLPAGASSATLTSAPPAGVLVLSPFAKAGARPSLRFNPTSPSQSLRALLG